MNYIQLLPNELLFDIGLLLPIPAIAAFSLTESRLNNLIAQNDLYWKIRYQQDFGTFKLEVTDWKQKYVDSVTGACITLIPTVQFATAAVLSAAPALIDYTSPNVLTEPGVGTALFIDGFAMVGGERILVKDEPSAGSLARLNGIFDVTNAGGVGVSWVLTRASDFNQATAAGAGIPKNTFVFVENSGGTVNDGTQWLLDSALTDLDATGASDLVIWDHFGCC